MAADKNILRRRKDSTLGLIRIERPLFMSSEEKSLHYAVISWGRGRVNVVQDLKQGVIYRATLYRLIIFRYWY